MPDTASPSARRERIALVLAGGGARGAYEIGVLAALAPALEERGQTPDIIIGTSIGALNGAFFAARADEPFQAVASEAVQMWREITWDDALRPLVSPRELRRFITMGAMLAGLPGSGPQGMLDPGPLRETVERLVSFERITRNVKNGNLTAAAVVATAYATTRSMVFHQGGPELGLDPTHAIDYAATRIATDHVLASAAIPGAFPAIEIRSPRVARGWYSDGGVRLNAPLTPALALGADRVVVIGLNSSVTHARASARPDAIDGVAQLLQVVLADQLAADVSALAGINEALPAKAGESGGSRGRGGSGGSGGSRGSGGEDHEGRRRIPYIFIAPADRLEIGRLARDVYKRHYAGLPALLRESNLALLGRLVNAGRSPIHGELLSYLFLANEFLDELIALGRRDGERWLEERHDAGLWQIGRMAIAAPDEPAKPARARKRRPPARI
jgi:NTE family protein